MMFESIANDMECCQTVGAFVGVSLEGNIVATSCGRRMMDGEVNLWESQS